MTTARTVKASIAAVVVALVSSAVAGQVWGFGSSNPIDSHPQPDLFPPAVVQPLAVELARQKPAADEAFASWGASHPQSDDAAFVAFAVSQTPDAPRPAQRERELAEVRELASARTGHYIATSTWLELYGKTEIWKTYRHQYSDVQPKSRGRAAKDELKHTRTLTSEVTSAAQARFHLDAPFITDPTLRTDKDVRPGSHKLSYPSKHAVEAFSAATLLSSLEPLRTAEYDNMAAQVAYSRLYMAGHYRSDLVAGAFLGYLIGDYETAHQTVPKN